MQVAALMCDSSSAAQTPAQAPGIQRRSIGHASPVCFYLWRNRTRLARGQAEWSGWINPEVLAFCAVTQGGHSKTRRIVHRSTACGRPWRASATICQVFLTARCRPGTAGLLR